MADIYAQGPRKGFTTVFNSVARDPRLSLTARGLFLTMESLPPGWAFSESGLCTVCGCGRTRLRAALKELTEAGYLTRKSQHDAAGKFSGQTYLLLQESPLSQNPTAENEQPLSRFPTAENPPSENVTEYKIKIKKKKEENTPLTPQGDEPELFTRFWALYPKKRKKRDALRAWEKLDPDMELCREMSRALKVQIASYDWQKDNGQYIPYPATWLRGRMWEDDYSTPPGFDETPPDDAAGGYYL